MAAGGALGPVARDPAGVRARGLLDPRAPGTGFFTVDVAGGFAAFFSYLFVGPVLARRPFA